MMLSDMANVGMGMRDWLTRLSDREDDADR